MKLSAEEKLMYQVMKAIYESGIPVSWIYGPESLPDGSGFHGRCLPYSRY